MKKTLNWLLALGLAATVAGCSSGEPAANGGDTPKDEPEVTVDLTSYKDFVNAKEGDPVVVETYVQAKQSWWDNKATLYTQNEDGAFFVYEAEISEEDYNKLVEGQKIRVTGVRAEYAGEIEIGSDENGKAPQIEILDGNWIAPVTDVTDILNSAKLLDAQNLKVAFKGLTIEDYDGKGNAIAYKNDENKTDDIYFKASLGDAVLDFTIEFYLTGEDTDVYKTARDLKVGDTVDLEGFLYWYEGPNAHITNITVH